MGVLVYGDCFLVEGKFCFIGIERVLIILMLMLLGVYGESGFKCIDKLVLFEI